MASQQQSTSEHKTGVRDEHYNLVSVLYHALKAVETYEQYCRDAREAGDADLEQFFRDVQEDHRAHAERARNLLGARLHGGAHASSGAATAGGGAQGKKARPAMSTTNASVKSGGKAGDDCVDESSKESFPASDAPASY